MEIPTTEPTKITAGDTLAWTKSLPDYLASAGYVLHYVLQPVAGGTPISIDATASGDDHAISVAAALTTSYAAGDYRWHAFVTQAAARYSIDSGSLTILPDPLNFTSATDLRSHAKKVLDAIEAVLENRASRSDEEYEIDIAGNKQKIKNVAIGDLLALRTKYLIEVQREQNAEALAKGLGSGGRILTRFV